MSGFCLLVWVGNLTVPSGNLIRNYAKMLGTGGNVLEVMMRQLVENLEVGRTEISLWEVLQDTSVSKCWCHVFLH